MDSQLHLYCKNSDVWSKRKSKEKHSQEGGDSFELPVICRQVRRTEMDQSKGQAREKSVETASD